GVTLHHPHCQIYAFPFVPPVVARELASSRDHLEGSGECLFCSILAREIAEGARIVCEGGGHIALVPFYARWPYEVHVFPRRHVSSLAEMNTGERRDLARTIKTVATKYDSLFGFPLPYVMVLHQAPTDGGDHRHYHFHVEFYPPHRAGNRLKYLAGVELGAGVFLNDAEPEQKARELRELNPDA
ncbi:MAG: galactose-1-phosphate uridylyltransferase, partial [Gemmatimonadetes bacterium]|nr:galactose-1-phosphate uridylyltransferase [Gemmatimonadota bacterium]